MDSFEGLTFDMISNVSDNAVDTAEKDIDEGIEMPDEQTEDIDTTDGDDVILENIRDQEGVGGEVQEDGEDTDSFVDSSPNFYASIATSLKTDGILDLLEDSDFEEIENADDLAALFMKQRDEMLEAQNKRISEALNAEVPVDIIKQYEGVLNYLGSIDESTLRQESADLEQLRGNLIVQDYMNKGFSQERANRAVEKSFNAGTDVEDAIEALKELKAFYTTQYNQSIEANKQDKEKEVSLLKKQSQEIEKRLLETEEPIKGIKLSKYERKKMAQQYLSFVDKDKNNQPLNAVQKFAKENPIDYQYSVNLLYYITDGFKDLGKAIQKEVKRNTKSALKSLEGTLRNPSNQLGGGGLNFDNDKSTDSYKGISIAFD